MASKQYDEFNAKLKTVPGYLEAIRAADPASRRNVVNRYAAIAGIRPLPGPADERGQVTDPAPDHWYTGPLMPAALAGGGFAAGAILPALAPAAAGTSTGVGAGTAAAGAGTGAGAGTAAATGATAAAAPAGRSILGTAGKLAPILAAAAKSRGEAQRENEILNISRGNLDLNRREYERDSPGIRASSAARASMIANYIPMTTKLGEPGYGLRGEAPEMTGGFNNPEMYSPDAKRVASEAVSRHLQAMLRGEDTVPDDGPVGTSSGLDKLLGLGAFGANAAGAFNTGSSRTATPGQADLPEDEATQRILAGYLAPRRNNPVELNR